MTAVDLGLPRLRTSERSAFGRCQARWWWAYREGLKPKGAEKTALWFGTGVHLGFAEWYLPGTKRGRHPAETFAEYAKDAMRRVKVADATEDTVAQYEDASELGVVLMEEYVKHYGTDPNWHFIQSEQPFELAVPWPKDRQQIYVVDEDSGTMVLYNGTYDGVYRDLADGRIKLLETKTAKAIQTGHLPMDNQAGSYWAVASYTLRKLGLIKPSESIAGINYNFVRKALPDDRPKDAEGYATNKPKKEHYLAALEKYAIEVPPKALVSQLEELCVTNRLPPVIGERSLQQPTPIFERHMVTRTSTARQTQLRRIQDEYVQMQAIKDGFLPVTKTPTKDCSWDCDYYSMCQLQEEQADWETYRQVNFKVQDPYADHRKSTED